MLQTYTHILCFVFLLDVSTCDPVLLPNIFHRPSHSLCTQLPYYPKKTKMDIPKCEWDSLAVSMFCFEYFGCVIVISSWFRILFAEIKPIFNDKSITFWLGRLYVCVCVCSLFRLLICWLDFLLWTSSVETSCHWHIFMITINKNSYTYIQMTEYGHFKGNVSSINKVKCAKKENQKSQLGAK